MSDSLIKKRLIDSGFYFDPAANTFTLEHAEDDTSVALYIQPRPEGRGADLWLTVNGSGIGRSIPVQILPPPDADAFRSVPFGLGASETFTRLDPGLNAAATITRRVRGNLKQTAKGDWQADYTAEVERSDSGAGAGDLALITQLAWLLRKTGDAVEADRIYRATGMEPDDEQE